MVGLLFLGPDVATGNRLGFDHGLRMIFDTPFVTKVEFSPMTKVFLSYSRRDDAAFRAIQKEIERAGFELVDLDVVPRSEYFRADLNEGFTAAKYFILLWSQAAAQSAWVEQEVRRALKAW